MAFSVAPHVSSGRALVYQARTIYRHLSPYWGDYTLASVVHGPSAGINHGHLAFQWVSTAAYSTSQRDARRFKMSGNRLSRLSSRLSTLPHRLDPSTSPPDTITEAAAAQQSIQRSSGAQTTFVGCSGRPLLAPDRSRTSQRSIFAALLRLRTHSFAFHHQLCSRRHPRVMSTPPLGCSVLREMYISTCQAIDQADGQPTETY